MSKIENILMESVVKSWFFDADDISKAKKMNRYAVEFMITPNCSKSCSYCYIQKHREYLYPDNIINNDIIISNMRSFLNYLKLNKKVVPMIDLFSGEIWGEDFGYQILNTLLEFAKEYKYTEYISMATNMDFLFTENGEKWMDYFIDEFSKLGVRMNISASIDGALLEQTYRPQNKNYEIDISYDSSYYDKIFSFQSRHGFGLHPMVYSKNCKYWCENFDWFMDMSKKYYGYYKEPMMLEVRDNNWSEEDIEYYKKFLLHTIKFRYEKICNSDNAAFAQYLCRIRSYRKLGNNNIGIYTYNHKLNCTIPKTIFIRLGDMAIIPCHRTAYPDNIYGYMNIDGKNMNITANNFKLMLNVIGTKPNNDYPKCKDCIYKKLCLKGCLGSQYETNKNMFVPCDTVCNMYKAKINLLVDVYTSMGIYDILKEFPETKYIVDIVEEFKNKRIMSGDISDIK